MDKKWLWILLAVYAGYAFSDKIATLPGVGKLPKF
jgi:hypothetical protein